MVSLGAVLEQFPDEVITYITDPRTGIQRRLKWPPTINEIVEACEEHRDYLVRIRTQRPVIAERLPAPSLAERPPGSKATIFVPEGHSRYAKLVKWAETAEPLWWKYGKSSDGRHGIWVSWSAWNGEV
jgi:hypothetical protein